MSQVFDRLFPARQVLDYSMYSEIPKKIRQPTSIKINIENFQQFLSEFSMFIGNVEGLDISMKFSKPSATDAKFAELYSESLDGDTPTEYTRTLLRELDTAVKSYERIDTNVRTYLVSCAGTDETLRRKFINHQGDAYSLVRELATDYNKKSSNNAITEKAKMYLLTYSATTTNEEFIDKLELAVTAIENAGGKVDYDEIALRALNCAVDCERFQMKVTAYMTTNELNAKTPSWTEVKAYLLSLDRTVKSPGNNSDKPSNLKIMYTDDGEKKKQHDKKKQKNRYRFCTRESCMTRHPDGEHLDGSKNKSSVPNKKQSNAELIAAAVVEAINQDKRNRFQSRGANQFANSFHRNRGDRYRPDDDSNSFNGECFYCHKPGHTQWECRNNPKSQAYTGRKPSYHPRDRANFTQDAEDADSADYYAALDRSTRGRFSANVLRDNVEAQALFTAFENEFMMLYDTAATKIFVKNSWHRLTNSRRINREVATAGRGKITTIREGFIGRASVYGMSDELQVQLVGGRALAALGYTVIINDDGATFTHEDDTPTCPTYFVPWVDDLLPIDIRKLKVFQISPNHLTACTVYDRFNTPFTKPIRQETTEEGPFSSSRSRIVVPGYPIRQPPATIGDWMLVDDA